MYDRNAPRADIVATHVAATWTRVKLTSNARAEPPTGRSGFEAAIRPNVISHGPVVAGCRHPAAGHQLGGRMGPASALPSFQGFEFRHQTQV